MDGTSQHPDGTSRLDGTSQHPSGTSRLDGTLHPGGTPRPDGLLHHGDNLDELRGMRSGTVDLVYLDPPFNSGRPYSISFGADMGATAFGDSWRWGPQTQMELDAIPAGPKGAGPLVASLVSALGFTRWRRTL